MPLTTRWDHWCRFVDWKRRRSDLLRMRLVLLRQVPYTRLLSQRLQCDLRLQGCIDLPSFHFVYHDGTAHAPTTPLVPKSGVHFQWLWHSLKDKEVHLKAYAKMSSRASASAKSFRFYNKRRLHQALSYPTPEAAWRGEPCGFAAALGRRWRVAHNSTGPTTAKPDIHLTRRRSGLHVTNPPPYGPATRVDLRQRRQAYRSSIRSVSKTHLTAGTYPHFQCQ